LEEILESSSEKIVSHVESFKYETYIGEFSSQFFGSRIAHLVGYIGNNEKFMGYHSQSGKLIPRINYITPAAVSTFYRKKKIDSQMNIIFLLILL